MTDKHGYIYVLTNTSFPEYVKIGYADNVDERVAQLNRIECTPFAFKKYDAKNGNLPLFYIEKTHASEFYTLLLRVSLCQ